MNWKKLISDLKSVGISETQLAELIKSTGVPATQPTINRIKSGYVSNPGYELGNAIVSMHHKYFHLSQQKSNSK